MRRLKVGVIGAGDIAEKHLEVLAAFNDIEIAALCSRGHPRIYALAERFKVTQTFTDHRAMLDAVKFDAVFVLVSATQVAEVSAECLRRGLPTFMEKPPGLSVAETKGLLEIANSNGCLNMVGLNRRFFSVMEKASDAVLETGPIVSIAVEAPEKLAAVKALGMHPPEVIKGLLFANSVHCIDLLRFFGGDIKTICSLAGQWDEGQKNSFGALIRFEGGAMGQYVSNWMAPGSWNVTLYGYGRRVSLNPLERGTITDSGGESRALEPDELDTQFRPGLYRQDRYFLDCVTENRKVTRPAADLADALKTMELVELIGQGE